jgi:hypothetical protein
MDHCLGGNSRRAGLPLPLKARSNNVNRSLKADRVGATARKGATKSRATSVKEPGD